MNSDGQKIPTIEQKKTLWQAAMIAAFFVLILAAVVVGYGLLRAMSLLSSVLVPLGVAGIISILLKPVIELASTHLPLHRNRATILVLAIFFGLGAVLFFLTARSLLSFATNLPELVRQFNLLVQAQFRQNPALVDVLIEAAERMRVVLPTVTTAVVSFFLSTVNSAIAIFAYVAGFIFVPLYTYYFLLNSETIVKQWQEYIPLRQSKFRDELAFMVGEISRYIVTYFRGQITIGFTIGGIIALGLIILNLQYALLIGLFAGFVGLIPYLGAIMAIVPGVTLAYLQSNGDWGYVLLVALVFALASQAESLYIGPKIMGNRTGLHPVTVILSLFFWSAIIGGVLGLMLAVPLTATVRVLLQRYVWQRESAELPPGDPPPA
ncbi:MAG: AI-2E family transporter [Chloroflexi bacterium]|nr:AI-2E family transporter [Chloroflexota bacterium]